MWAEIDSLVIISICFFAAIAEVCSYDVKSPCPDIFSYHYDGRKTLYGEILIKEVPPNILQVNVELSVGNKVGKDNSGDLELSKPKEQVHQDILDSKPIVYKVNFPKWTTNPPRITRILVGGVLICSGPPIPERSVSVITTINISHTLTWSSRPRSSSNTPKENSIFKTEDSPSLENIHSHSALVVPADPAKVYSSNPFFRTRTSQMPAIIFGQKAGSPSNTPKEESTSKEEDSLPSGPYGGGAEKTMQYDLKYYVENIFARPKLVVPADPVKIYNTNPFFGIFEQKNEMPFKIIPTASIREEMLEEEVEDPFGGEPNISPHRSRPPISAVCGRPSTTMFRVINGDVAPQIAHPWLAALYHSRVEGILYKCCGSLISYRHVITAAHCVNVDGRDLKPEKLVIILGKRNLQRFAVPMDGSEMIQPESVVVHPNYKYNNADADIAILELSRDVRFSKHILPLCLWTENSDVSNIVGMDGMIVGWGTDSKGVLTTDEPKQIKLPIVSQETCLRSAETFFQITSFRTFCAGSRDGNGPCIGDSGSGFVMNRNGKWTLRGIVSISLQDTKTGSCDLSNYVAFTDVSKHSDWLNGFMKNTS